MGATASCAIMIDGKQEYTRVFRKYFSEGICEYTAVDTHQSIIVDQVYFEQWYMSEHSCEVEWCGCKLGTFTCNGQGSTTPEYDDDTSSPSGVLGDVNGDGVVNLSDMLIIINNYYYIMDNPDTAPYGQLTTEQFNAADLDGDGEITAEDLGGLLYLVLNGEPFIEEELPNWGCLVESACNYNPEAYLDCYQNDPPGNAVGEMSCCEFMDECGECCNPFTSDTAVSCPDGVVACNEWCCGSSRNKSNGLRENLNRIRRDLDKIAKDSNSNTLKKIVKRIKYLGDDDMGVRNGNGRNGRGIGKLKQTFGDNCLDCTLSLAGYNNCGGMFGACPAGYQCMDTGNPYQESNFQSTHECCREIPCNQPVRGQGGAGPKPPVGPGTGIGGGPRPLPKRKRKRPGSFNPRPGIPRPPGPGLPPPNTPPVRGGQGGKGKPLLNSIQQNDGYGGGDTRGTGTACSGWCKYKWNAEGDIDGSWSSLTHVPCSQFNDNPNYGYCQCPEDYYTNDRWYYLDLDTCGYGSEGYHEQHAPGHIACPPGEIWNDYWNVCVPAFQDFATSEGRQFCDASRPKCFDFNWTEGEGGWYSNWYGHYEFPGGCCTQHSDCYGPDGPGTGLCRLHDPNPDYSSFWPGNCESDTYTLPDGTTGVGTCGCCRNLNEECFVAGTKITMENGPDVNIEDVKIGDEVLSYNVKSKQLETKVVTDLITQTHDLKDGDLTVKVTFDNGVTTHNTIANPFLSRDKGFVAVDEERCNRIHPWVIETNGGKKVENLSVNDIVYTYNEDGELEEVKVTDIEYIMEEGIRTYDITVEDNHTFFANGILTHNSFGRGGKRPKARRAAKSLRGRRKKLGINTGGGGGHSVMTWGLDCTGDGNIDPGLGGISDSDAPDDWVDGGTQSYGDTTCTTIYY